MAAGVACIYRVSYLFRYKMGVFCFHKIKNDDRIKSLR